MKLKTDLERAEFIMRLPFIRDFEIKNKSGIKCVEKAVKYREEGNKLFQSEQCTQAILFYNKSISYCPHPTYDQWQQGLEQEQEKVKEVQFADECKDPNKKVPSKYESLSLSYGNRQTCKRCLTMFKDGEYNIFGDAHLNKLFPPKLGTYLQRSSCEGFEDKGSISDGNTRQANILLRFLKCADCIFTSSDTAYMSGTRSAALRKLNQYEDCLKDIARAAKFGYPKASIYKLWERKGKCYEVEFQMRVH